MPAPIDFYFDFSSPYGYIASELIDALAARHGRSVMWHPILLGASFKLTGQQPVLQVPLKGDYARRDVERSARFYGLPYQHPEQFPLATQQAARAFIWLNDQSTAQARDLAHAVYRDYFVAGGNISTTERVLELAAGVGVAPDALADALASAALKERLKAEVELALSRGVFGSPFFIVEGEPFWGADRLPQLERWLGEGAF